MTHHPDRGGSKAKFQEIKAAWELIEGGWSEPIIRPQPTQTHHRAWTKPEPAYNFAESFDDPTAWQNSFGRKTTRAYQRTAPKIQPIGPRIVEAYRPPEIRTNKGDFIARVSIAEAYRGFICEVEVDKVKYRVNIPPGIPHNLRFTVPIRDHDDVTVITRFTQSVYKFVGVDTALQESVIVNSAPAVVYRTKDLKLFHEVHVRELNRGTTLELQDFLGETYKVKVPADHNPKIPIRVEGRGYVDWYTTYSKAGEKRGDVLITIVPTEKTDPTVLR